MLKELKDFAMRGNVVDMASANRSVPGKNKSRSMTPTRVAAGVCAYWMMSGRARSSPCAYADRRMVENRICSRLLIGSASTPTRPSTLVAVV
jgi:hypothetical protein